MAVKFIEKSGRRTALALVLAAIALPGMAQAQDRDGGRGGWNRAERQASDNAQSARPQPRQNGEPGREWNGGNRATREAVRQDSRPNGGWQRPQAQPAQQTQPAPQAQPAPQTAPQVRWSGGTDGNRAVRGGGNGGNRSWQGGTAPAPQAQPRWNGGTTQRTQGTWNQTDNRNRGERERDRIGNTDGRNPGGSAARDSNRSRDTDRWRDSNRSRDNDRYRDAERRRDTDRWRDNNRTGDRHARNDYRRWDNRWRDNNRYNWYSYRHSNPSIYRLGSYYAPYRNYSYRRLSIGFYLDSLFFGDRYWINDPWQYRLPDVYGPYRWVRYYDDALLVDIYSGEVVDVMYDFFW